MLTIRETTSLILWGRIINLHKLTKHKFMHTYTHKQQKTARKVKWYITIPRNPSSSKEFFFYYEGTSVFSFVISCTNDIMYERNLVFFCFWEKINVTDDTKKPIHKIPIPTYKPRFTCKLMSSQVILILWHEQVLPPHIISNNNWNTRGNFFFVRISQHVCTKKKSRRLNFQFVHFRT